MVRVLRRGIPVLLLVVALPLVAQPQSSSTPPRELHLVGDHWTPYNPPDPATFPPGSKVHIIEKGDTLWDLAEKYYGNAYLWPQLWEANTYITDAHWIYPGDPLLVQGETTTGEVTTETGVETQTGDEGTMPEITTQVAPIGPPIPLGTDFDIFCYGYIGHPDEPLPNEVMAFEDTDKYIPFPVEQVASAMPGEFIHIAGGTSTGIVAGETYLVVRPDDLVEHPATGEVVGRHYSYRGRIRILCATEDRATGIVTQMCNTILLRDRLKPIPQLPIPLARMSAMADVCSSSSGKSSGYIVHAKDFEFAIGIGTVVDVNLGRDDFVEPGDFLTVFRENPRPGSPRQVVGEVGVLTAESRTATARVVNMRYEMRIGDRVEVK